MVLRVVEGTGRGGYSILKHLNRWEILPRIIHRRITRVTLSSGVPVLQIHWEDNKAHDNALAAQSLRDQGIA